MAQPSHPSDFLITDPLAQPDVVEAVPAGVEVIDLDDVPYRAEPYVRCALCAVRRLHRDGYFAILSNGTRVPCGNCCAAQFDAVKKRTIDKRRLHLHKAREDRARARTLAARAEAIDDIIKVADETEGAVYFALLVLREVLSDEACDDMSAHGVQGTLVLHQSMPLLHEARKTVYAIHHLDAITAEQFDRYEEACRKAADEIDAVLPYLAACLEFFASANIETLSQWAASRGREFGVIQLQQKGPVLKCKGPGHWQNIDLPEVPRAVKALLT